MRRRAFITLLGSAAAWPLAARAQQPARPRRIGLLSASPVSTLSGIYTGFMRGIRELGYVEGKDLCPTKPLPKTERPVVSSPRHSLCTSS
jgi:putative tryptophan/tyrosine transport system substrate-binding protein